MARTKKVAKAEINPDQPLQQASLDVAEELANLFNEVTKEKYGTLNPPSAYVTSTGIKPLDALLGGGITSSSVVTFSSTPETGKSSIAYQFAKTFLDENKNGLCVYFDVESAGGRIESSGEILQQSRAESFGLSTNPRFIYNNRPYSIKDFFEYIDELVNKKRELQSKTGQEVKMLVVLDSITALTYSKLEAIESFDKIPGEFFWV